MSESRHESDAAQASGAPRARRIAVLGLGRAGLAYAAACAASRECELAALVDASGRRRSFARAAGFAAPMAASLERLRTKSPIDGVVVACAPAERAAALESARAANLAVMVDGLPVADAAGAGRLEALVEGARASIGCAVGLLFHPLFARAADVIASGALGAVREVRASVHVSRVFAAGAPPRGGDVLDFAVADLLMLVDAVFGPPESAVAGGQRLYGERLDEVHARLALPGGVEALVDGSWSVPGYPRASYVLEVAGARGGVLVSDDALEADLMTGISGVPAGHTRRVLADEPDPLAFEGGDAARAVEAFAHALQGGGMAYALDPRRALRTARLLDVLRRSAAGEVTA